MTTKMSLPSLPKLVRDQKGQGLVEYALILVLIAIVVVAALSGLGSQVTSTFTTINSQMAAP